MTALKKYERLECIGLWRSNPAAQRREVILSFGKATLVLTDTQNRALSHWSLAAVEIQKGKSGQATLRPGFDAEESIEIDDRTMLDALLKVKKEISQSAPHPGKLRLILAIALITILSILSLFLGPQAITSYAGKILPNTKQLQLSEEIEQRIGQLAGPYCETPEGKSAAQKLIKRLKIQNLTKILILPGQRDKAIVIPNGKVILFENMINAADNPEVTAGYILSALSDYQNERPIQTHLSNAGVFISISLIMSNQLSEVQINILAKNALSHYPKSASNTTLLKSFNEAQVSISPFAKLKKSNVSNNLIINDPYPTKSPSLILPDGAWLGLKSICSEM